MATVKDKELLTFCNLANLQMEFANYIKSQTINSEGKTEYQYHTIYSL